MAAPTRRLPAPLYDIKKKLTGPSPVTGPPTEANLAAASDEDRIAAWEAYLIPGLSDDVLRNKLGRSWAEPFGCPDHDELIRLEERFTAIRMIELKQHPVQGDFSLRHMKAIHRHLFQDVYDWAGEHRDVDMVKQGHDYMAHFQIERLWGKVSDFVERNNRLQGIEDPAVFADKIAFVWGRVNIIHAFREGNTRSQVLFFDQLCKQAGWELDAARLSPAHPQSVRDEFVAARFHHQDNAYDHQPLAALLGKLVRPASPTLEQRLELAASTRQSQWSPESRRPTPSGRSDYSDPDTMRTAHRRPTIQEDTMAIDPSKQPQRLEHTPAQRGRRLPHDPIPRRSSSVQHQEPSSPAAVRLWTDDDRLIPGVAFDAELRDKSLGRGLQSFVTVQSTLESETPGALTADGEHWYDMTAIDEATVRSSASRSAAVDIADVDDYEEDTLRVELAADMENDDFQMPKDEPKGRVWLDERMRRFPELRPTSFNPPPAPTGRHRAVPEGGPSL